MNMDKRAAAAAARLLAGASLTACKPAGEDKSTQTTKPAEVGKDTAAE